jgi:DNA polymerase-3 subunit epsilon
MIHVRNLQATAEVVAEPGAGAMAALTEETEILLRWLEAPGVRIVELDGSWTCPLGGAGALRHELEPAVTSALDVIGFDRDAGLDAGRDPGRTGFRSRFRRAG